VPENDATAALEDVTELSWEDLVLDLGDDPEQLVDSTGLSGSCQLTGCENLLPSG
jgi:hypothetical protein